MTQPPCVAIEEAQRRYPDKLIGGDVKMIRQAFCEGWMVRGERDDKIALAVGACACGNTVPGHKFAYPRGHGYESCVVERGK